MIYRCNGKKYKILSILKPYKPFFNESSYRPICVLKTFERILKSKLEWWLEINNKLTKTQYVFRKNCSTIDCINHLVTDIRKAFRLLANLFIDIKGTYDNVDLLILVKNMVKIGILENIAKLIYELYSDREIYIKATSVNIRRAQTSNIGILQESILSPLLYVIYTTDLEQIFSQQNKIIQCTDDICNMYNTLHLAQR